MYSSQNSYRNIETWKTSNEYQLKWGNNDNITNKIKKRNVI